jgi:protein-disulfide isomerase
MDQVVQKAEETKTESKATITIKKSHLLVGLAIALFLIGFGSGYFFNDLVTGAVAGPSNNQQLNPPEEENELFFVSADDDPVLGQANAPITIIEFSDYQCPFCAKAALQIEPQIRKDYIDTGKVKFVFRDFPLEFHANAKIAAIAAECAAKQGKYWEFHDALYAEQANWSQEQDPIPVFSQIATKLSLNVDQWKSCLNDIKISNEIDKDFSDGMESKVGGTPTFFIGNDKKGYVKIIGAQPYEVFKQAIESALANS